MSKIDNFSFFLHKGFQEKEKNIRIYFYYLIKHSVFQIKHQGRDAVLTSRICKANSQDKKNYKDVIFLVTISNKASSQGWRLNDENLQSKFFRKEKI